MHPSWVHVMANGLHERNKCFSFAFKCHWIKKEKSQKQHGPIFRADAYCTFSSCPVIAKLTISNKSIQADNVIAQVNFTGFVHHATGEKQARKISSSVRSQLKQHFQSTHVAPSKEYHKQLKMLASEHMQLGTEMELGALAV